MGNGLPRVSTTCIPVPSDDFKEHLQKRGVIFGKIHETKRMVTCELPQGWGIITYSDRGDMSNHYLLDEEGKTVAHISWMSKGSYDNEASLRAYTEKQLNTSKCTLLNGIWTLNISKERKHFNELYEEYLIMPQYGTSQDDIDQRYQQLCKLNDGYIKSLERLQAHSSEQHTGDAIFNLQQEGITKERYTTIEIPWI